MCVCLCMCDECVCECDVCVCAWCVCISIQFNLLLSPVNTQPAQWELMRHWTYVKIKTWDKKWSWQWITEIVVYVCVFMHTKTRVQTHTHTHTHTNTHNIIHVVVTVINYELTGTEPSSAQQQSVKVHVCHPYGPPLIIYHTNTVDFHFVSITVG